VTRRVDLHALGIARGMLTATLFVALGAVSVSAIWACRGSSPTGAPPEGSAAAEESTSWTVGASSLHGAWTLDPDLRESALPEAHREAFAPLAASMEGTVRFEPTGEFTIVSTMMGQRERLNGTYEVREVRGTNVHFRMSVRQVDGSEDVREMRATFDGTTRIAIRDDDERPDERVPVLHYMRDAD